MGTVVLVLALIVFVGVIAFSGGVELAVARVIVVALSLLIALDLVGTGLSWSSAATRAQAVDHRLDAATGAGVEAQIAIIADYAISTATASPIPDGVYEAEKETLNGLWVERRGGQTV